MILIYKLFNGFNAFVSKLSRKKASYTKPETVLFSDFWVSNISRYFCFALHSLSYNFKFPTALLFNKVSLLSNQWVKNIQCCHSWLPYQPSVLITSVLFNKHLIVTSFTRISKNCQRFFISVLCDFTYMKPNHNPRHDGSFDLRDISRERRIVNFMCCTYAVARTRQIIRCRLTVTLLRVGITIYTIVDNIIICMVPSCILSLLSRFSLFASLLASLSPFPSFSSIPLYIAVQISHNSYRS